MAPSEIMAIVIFYHFSGFKCFKYFYCQGILKTWKSYFPKAVSYNRFIELKKEVKLALFFFIHYAGPGDQTGTYFIDSTKMAVCDNHRIHNHKVFKALANRGKTSMGWFYGLKLHLLVNEKGELIINSLAVSLKHLVDFLLHFSTSLKHYAYAICNTIDPKVFVSNG